MPPTTLFNNQQNFLHSDLKMMMVCNSQRFTYQQEFYSLKKELLTKFGTFDGYDKQIIKTTCNMCIKGVFTRYDGGKEQCYACDGKGIYSTRIWKLERHILNDVVFHTPVQNSCYEGFEHKNIIEGRVKHVKCIGNPIFCYGVLCFKYNKEMFFKLLISYGSNLQTRAKYKWRQIFQKSGSQINGWLDFFGFKGNDVEELPF